MKKKDLQNTRTKKIEALEKLAGEKKLEFIKIKLAMKVGKEKNSRKAKNLRREIAQILTIIREKELVEQSDL
ncbi:50S ribosomal protein L29 [Patescibacteria group bacterium]|nr:50S ribosomal protein L29 [Patescibacteria group bacterium]